MGDEKRDGFSEFGSLWIAIEDDQLMKGPPVL